MVSEFRGVHSFLSNFYILSTPIRWETLIYPSSEHLFVAFKTKNETDRAWISMLARPSFAKWAGSPRGYEGRKITLRHDWEHDYRGAPIKVHVMRHTLMLKYFANPQLIRNLCATYPKQLIEGNKWHDNYWGNCICPKCAHIPGENILGRLHMELRELWIMID